MGARRAAWTGLLLLGGAVPAAADLYGVESCYERTQRLIGNTTSGPCALTCRANPPSGLPSALTACQGAGGLVECFQCCRKVYQPQGTLLLHMSAELLTVHPQLQDRVTCLQDNLPHPQIIRLSSMDRDEALSHIRNNTLRVPAEDILQAAERVHSDQIGDEVQAHLRDQRRQELAQAVQELDEFVMNAVRNTTRAMAIVDTLAEKARQRHRYSQRKLQEASEAETGRWANTVRRTGSVQYWSRKLADGMSARRTGILFANRCFQGLALSLQVEGGGAVSDEAAEEKDEVLALLRGVRQSVIEEVHGMQRLNEHETRSYGALVRRGRWTEDEIGADAGPAADAAVASVEQTTARCGNAVAAQVFGGDELVRCCAGEEGRIRCAEGQQGQGMETSQEAMNACTVVFGAGGGGDEEVIELDEPPAADEVVELD